MHVDDLSIRASGISGTAIGVIVGENPFRKPIELWRSLVEPSPPTDDDREILTWGQDLEPLVLRRYERRTGLLVRGGMRTLRSRKHPWQIGTPDGLAYDEAMVVRRTDGEWIPSGPVITTVELAADGSEFVLPQPERMLEIKTHGWYVGQQYGDEDTDDVPEHILAQVTWYLGMLGLDHADLAVLSNTHTFRIFRVHFDQALYDVLLDAGDRFWRHNVLERIEPEPDGSQAYSDWINQRTRDAVDVVVADDELLATVTELRTVKAERKAAEKREKLLVQQVQKSMAGALYLHDHQGQELAVWKRDRQGKIGWKAVAETRAIRLGMTDLEIDDENDRARGLAARPLRINGVAE